MKACALLLAILLAGCGGKPGYVRQLDECLDRAATHEQPWRTRYEDVCLDAAAVGVTR